MLIGSHKSKISMLVFVGWAMEPIISSSSQLCSWHFKPHALHCRDRCNELHSTAHPVSLVTTRCLEHSLCELLWEQFGHQSLHGTPMLWGINIFSYLLNNYFSSVAHTLNKHMGRWRAAPSDVQEQLCSQVNSSHIIHPGFLWTMSNSATPKPHLCSKTTCKIHGSLKSKCRKDSQRHKRLNLSLHSICSPMGP